MQSESSNDFFRALKKSLKSFRVGGMGVRPILNWQMTRKEIKESLIFYIIDLHQGLKKVFSRIEKKDLLNVAA